MRVLDLFSGIGGFSLGLERAGMQTVAFCENDKKARLVLKKHWPHVPIFEDVRNLTGEQISKEIGAVDLICGGFPCQPFSVAGKRKGTDDDRHLWPEYFRIIQEIRPRWVIGENVAGLINMGLDQVLSDLESEGYSCQTLVIPACAINAPHRRDRVWIMAHSKGVRWNDQGRDEVKNAYETIPNWGCEFKSFSSSKFPDSCNARTLRMANGIPFRVDRLKQLGNAVVPQVVEIIGRTIIEIDHVEL